MSVIRDNIKTLAFYPKKDYPNRVVFFGIKEFL